MKLIFRKTLSADLIYIDHKIQFFLRQYRPDIYRNIIGGLSVSLKHQVTHN